jgi:DNA modification methylase
MLATRTRNAGGAMNVRILIGDAREQLAGLPDDSVHCCVTSPPYFGLRDYGTAGQIGLEATPDEFVAALVGVFREVRRVLRKDGTLWLNLGDTYASAWPCNRRNVVGSGSLPNGKREARPPRMGEGLKEKDLIGIPWLVAFALRTDGWYLRQDIIWSKPNPMPESVTDRCTKAHEYLFLLSKSERYYYDHEAVAEELAEASVDRLAQANLANQRGSDRIPGKTNGAMKAVARRAKDGGSEARSPDSRPHSLSEFEAKNGRQYGRRNKRSVWTVTTQPFSEAHFATFPPALIEPCILAGCPKGGTVLDPFGGAGTTGLVADRNGRNAILIELNPDYAAMAERRIRNENPMFSQVEVSDSAPAQAAE